MKRNIKEQYGLRNNPFEFTNLGYANSFAANGAKMMLVILGDNGRFWACLPADAEKLHKVGLCYAE